MRVLLVLLALPSFAQINVTPDHAVLSVGYQERNTAESREGYRIDYQIHKAMAITLRNVPRFERLLTAVVSAGANRAYDQAREMAGNYGGGMMVNAVRNVASAGGDSTVSGTVAPGRIAVRAGVSPSFILIP